MEKPDAFAALAALAQGSRHAVLRRLVPAGTQGMPAGLIAEWLGMPANTPSFHLNQLRRAGLVTFRRETRSLIHAAAYGVMNDLLAYLTENGCRGDAASGGVGTCVATILVKPKETTRQ